MWRAILTVFVVALEVGLQCATVTAQTAQEEMVQEAESAFKSAMEAWAYEEYWRLWEMGTRTSRSALPREDFTDRMRRGNTRPAAGKQFEVIQVISAQPKSVMVYVRFGVEDRRRSWAESTERPFLLTIEEGRWTVSLWDFVGLANYFPPDSFPNQPLTIPAPIPPRSKGIKR